MVTLTLAAFTGASRSETFFKALGEGSPIAWIFFLAIIGWWIHRQQTRAKRPNEVVKYPSIFKTTTEPSDCENEKPCPNCRQSLPREASFCKHCREFLPTDLHKEG